HERTSPSPSSAAPPAEVPLGAFNPVSPATSSSPLTGVNSELSASPPSPSPPSLPWPQPTTAPPAPRAGAAHAMLATASTTANESLEPSRNLIVRRIAPPLVSP